MPVIKKQRPIADEDIPPSIARDTETAAAIAAHVAASDPHAQYLLQTEGDARYRQSSVALTDSDIPTAIARDTEVTAAINAHVAASDPHTQYLLQSEGDARYRQTATALTDSDIPAAIARDSEVTATMNAHLAASDPHAQYLLQAEGDARYRQNSVAITDAELPSTIARDTEVTAAINAHVAASDPHTQYLLQSEGDARYRQAASVLFTSSPLPTSGTAGNSIALSWNSVENGLGIAELCNYAGTGGGDAFNFFRMPGAANVSPGLSHRVSRIDITGAYIQTSDKRLKTDFSQAPGLNAILALVPQRYHHWECLGAIDVNNKKSLKLGKNFREKIGFLAQDVQKTLPEAVAATATEDELYGLDYNVIVACAVRAIQELEAQVQELRSQLTVISQK